MICLWSHAENFQIGNAYVDDETENAGMFNFFWTHALISDEIYEGIVSNCNFSEGATITQSCDDYASQAYGAFSNIYFYDIYAPLCSAYSNSTPSVSSLSILLNLKSEHAYLKKYIDIEFA